MNIPGPNSSLDSKIDFLIQAAVKADSQFSVLRDALGQTSSRISVVETEMGALQQGVLKVKTQVNRHEQYSRSLNVRIHNVPYSPDESPAKIAYDRVIKPILVLAKEKGKRAAVPQQSTIITEA